MIRVLASIVVASLFTGFSHRFIFTSATQSLVEVADSRYSYS